MAGEPKLILQQKLTGDFALHVYKDNRTKVTEIGLGSDEKAAGKNAQAIVDAIKGADGIIDETK